MHCMSWSKRDLASQTLWMIGLLSYKLMLWIWKDFQGYYELLLLNNLIISWKILLKNNVLQLGYDNICPPWQRHTLHAHNHCTEINRLFIGYPASHSILPRHCIIRCPYVYYWKHYYFMLKKRKIEVSWKYRLRIKLKV